MEPIDDEPELPAPDLEGFDPVACARSLVRRARVAALSTLARRTGHPYGSMISVAAESDGTPILLLSTLAAHSRNLAADPRASLLLEDRTAPDPQQGARITLVGRVETLAEPQAAARRYLARIPEAARYAGFADFAFFRLVVEDAHMVAGFGRAMRVKKEALLLDVSQAGDLLAAEPDLLAELARDPDRLARLAAKVDAAADAATGPWSAVALDPEGIDLAAEGNGTRAYRRLVLPTLSNTRREFLEHLSEWEESR